jgi:hypothetical protein
MSEPTKPNGFFDDGVTPCITLTGQRWPVPPFGVKQLRYGHDAEGGSECGPFGASGLEPEPELPNWDDIIATIINRSGGRWEDWEDDLTVARLEALYRSWGKEPPIAPFVAAYFGYEAPEAPDKPVNAIELFEMFPTGNISIEAAAPIMPHTGGR